MISLWTRANAVFFYSLSVLLCLACGSAVTALLLDATPVVRVLGVNKVLTLRPQQESLKRSAQDRAILTFNLDAGAWAAATRLLLLMLLLLLHYPARTPPP